MATNERSKAKQKKQKWITEKFPRRRLRKIGSETKGKLSEGQKKKENLAK